VLLWTWGLGESASYRGVARAGSGSQGLEGGSWRATGEHDRVVLVAGGPLENMLRVVLVAGGPLENMHRVVLEAGGQSAELVISHFCQALNFSRALL
jgi:hypothetical protein